jgi:hypothetical protein
LLRVHALGFAEHNASLDELELQANTLVSGAKSIAFFFNIAGVRVRFGERIAFSCEICFARCQCRFELPDAVVHRRFGGPFEIHCV